MATQGPMSAGWDVLHLMSCRSLGCIQEKKCCTEQVPPDDSDRHYKNASELNANSIELNRSISFNLTDMLCVAMSLWEESPGDPGGYTY